MTNFQVINGNNSSESLFAPDDRSKKYEINGFGGDDCIWSHMSDDTVRGGKGNDEILAFDGNDYILGNQGDDIIYGHRGDDNVYGGQGDDVLYGNQGHDILYGNKGNDWIFGGDGNDWINGGGGDDDIYGGEGSDTFQLSRGFDVIHDYNVWEDGQFIIDTDTFNIFNIDIISTVADGQSQVEIRHEYGITTLAGVTGAEFNWSSIDYV
jgi:Ca2+-binding RTX toxin-like protein